MRSRENHPSGCIFHRGVADVDPLREFLFYFALLILDTDGITGDGGNGQLSVSEGNGIGKGSRHATDGGYG